MPTYAFKCDVDGETAEERLPVALRDAEIICKHGHPMRRLFTPTAFQFGGKFSPEYWGYTEKRNDGLTPLAE